MHEDVTWSSLRELVEWARNNECTSVRVGEVEVAFAPKTTLHSLDFESQNEQADEETPNIMYYSS
jgi:hypothetical protein